MKPFTPQSVESLGKWTTFVILKIYLKCLLGFGPKDSNTSGVNRKREEMVMEVKESSGKRMFCPISGDLTHWKGWSPGVGRFSEAILERGFSLSFHCLSLPVQNS